MLRNFAVNIFAAKFVFMRLGQTSRTLNISSHKIVELISEHFREINDHPNVKLTDEEFDFVQNHFVVKQETEAPAEQTTAVEAPDEVEEQSSEATTPIPEFIEELRPKVIRLEDEFNEQKEGIDSYKVEKVALEGLKVLGKIDLPEPKPKDASEEKEEKEKPVKKKFERRSERKRSGARNGKKSLTPAEERARLDRIAYRKRVEEEERQKALKKKHYEHNVKAKIQTSKPKKKKKAPVLENTNTSSNGKAKQQKVKKATGLKRLWLWLNGAYDQHN